MTNEEVIKTVSDLDKSISVMTRVIDGDGGILRRLDVIEKDLKKLASLTNKLNGYYKFVSPIITGLITSGAVYLMMRR